MTSPARSTSRERTTRWTAPVRYAETDQQGVVFNAHYLTYCDEALAAFCIERGLGAFAEDVMLKSSTLTWAAGVRHGDRVDVDASCERVGRTSLLMRFVISVEGAICCEVDTTYVYAPDGEPMEVPHAARAVLV
ncbi:acyl-CoA thioesterase [Mumia flava]|nr:hotdog domain-containing protein [Mumia flava]